MTSVLIFLLVVLSAANLLLMLELTRLLCVARSFIKDLPKEVEKLVAEKLSRASFSWDTGFADRSVHIRFDNVSTILSNS